MLDGVVVLDLSRILAGPYCTQLLADLGARVIKVESPRGDDTRGWGPPYANDQSGYFLSVNRGKESVVLDLKTEGGRRIARGLAARADVLVENFKVGDLKRYGLDPDALQAVNPGLIYASITGYGSVGPRADRSGYDAALQAITGLMAMTGEEGGAPVKLGVAWIDVLTGLHAAVGVLAALHERTATGRGRVLELSLFETGLASLVNQAQGALLTNEAPKRLGSGHPSIVPYQVFATADAPLMLTVGNDAQFARACAVLGLPELAADPRYATNAERVRNRERLVPVVQERLRTERRDVWLARFDGAGVSATPVLDLPDALRDAQAAALGTVGRYRHPSAGEVPYVRSPLRHRREAPRSDAAEAAAGDGATDAGRPPLLGEHTRQVLSDLLGFGTEELAEAEREGAIRSVRAAPDGRPPRGED